MFYFWIIVIIVLSLIEIATVGLTTLWFVVSAVISLIISLFTDNIFIQFGAFTVIGFILLITTRPLINKLFKVSDIKTNLDRVIGMKGIVTEDIKKFNIGEVKVDGKKWSAVSDRELSKDTVVKILSIDGVKLKVEKWEE